MRPYKVVATEVTHIGRFDICMDTLEIDGNQYPYSYTKVKESICVLPIVRDEAGACKQVGLIYQYRHALDQWIYEIVAGSIEDGENPSEAALRELKEEMGAICELKDLIPLGFCYPVSGTSNERMHMFACLVDGFQEPAREATEYIKNEIVSFEAFEQMIQNGEFVNMYGIATWHKYCQNKCL